MARRICIVGFSEINRDWAQDQPKDVEFWGINEAHNCTEKLRETDELGRSRPVQCVCYNPHDCRCGEHQHVFLTRYDRWFQLHSPNWKDEKRIKKLAALGKRLDPRDLNCYGRNERHVRFLKECNKPLYMLYPNKLFPTAVRYPLTEITKAFGTPFGGKRHLYATSTPAFMLVLALYEHINGAEISEIRVAGLELAVGTEYFWQKPCVEYYLGWARGLGIKVIRPPTGSSLLAAPRYILDTASAIPADFKHEPIPIYEPTLRQVEEYSVPEVVLVN